MLDLHSRKSSTYDQWRYFFLSLKWVASANTFLHRNSPPKLIAFLLLLRSWDSFLLFICLSKDIVHLRRAPHDLFFKKWLNQLKTTLWWRTTTKYSFLDIFISQKGVPFFQASWAVPPLLASLEQKGTPFAKIKLLNIT